MLSFQIDSCKCHWRFRNSTTFVKYDPKRRFWKPWWKWKAQEFVDETELGHGEVVPCRDMGNNWLQMMARALRAGGQDIVLHEKTLLPAQIARIQWISKKRIDLCLAEQSDQLIQTVMRCCLLSLIVIDN